MIDGRSVWSGKEECLARSCVSKWLDCKFYTDVIIWNYRISVLFSRWDKYAHMHDINTQKS